MKNLIKVLAALLSLSAFGQQLKCCETVSDVSDLLNGEWRLEEKVPTRVLRYELVGGIGQLKVFTIDESGNLLPSEGALPVVSVLKTKNGFTLQHDFNGLNTYLEIDYLNSTRLVIRRSDGLEKAYQRY